MGVKISLVSQGRNIEGVSEWRAEEIFELGQRTQHKVRKIHNEDPRDLYSTSKIIKVMKPKRLR